MHVSRSVCNHMLLLVTVVLKEHRSRKGLNLVYFIVVLQYTLMQKKRMIVSNFSLALRGLRQMI